MTDAFSIPGIPSEKAADLQEELFPDAADAFDQASVTVVVAAPEGHTLAEKRYADRVGALVADLAELPQAPAPEAIVDPVAAAAGQEQQMVDAVVEAGTLLGDGAVVETGEVLSDARRPELDLA